MSFRFCAAAFAWLSPNWWIRVSIRGFEMLNRYPSMVLHGEVSFYPSILFSIFDLRSSLGSNPSTSSCRSGSIAFLSSSSS